MTDVDEVLDLYLRWGASPYDEEVAQLDHALQTAALAAEAEADDAVIVAALLHDVGHLLVMRGDQVGPHERTGPAFLSQLFPPSVTGPIALHVAAKRYLCAVEPTYSATLSTGSIRSLERQGGPMTAAEIAAFEATAGSAVAVALRRWDDGGKLDGVAVADLATYEPVLRAVACSAS
ncbi:MAG: HD domain-containing protein [Acidimicrobiales bacterium]